MPSLLSKSFYERPEISGEEACAEFRRQEGMQDTPPEKSRNRKDAYQDWHGNIVPYEKRGRIFNQLGSNRDVACWTVVHQTPSSNQYILIRGTLQSHQESLARANLKAVSSILSEAPGAFTIRLPPDSDLMYTGNVSSDSSTNYSIKEIMSFSSSAESCILMKFVSSDVFKLLEKVTTSFASADQIP